MRLFQCRSHLLRPRGALAVLVATAIFPVTSVCEGGEFVLKDGRTIIGQAQGLAIIREERPGKTFGYLAIDATGIDRISTTGITVRPGAALVSFGRVDGHEQDQPSDDEIIQTLLADDRIHGFDFRQTPSGKTVALISGTTKGQTLSGVLLGIASRDRDGKGSVSQELTITRDHTTDPISLPVHDLAGQPDADMSPLLGFAALLLFFTFFFGVRTWVRTRQSRIRFSVDSADSHTTNTRPGDPHGRVELPKG